MNRTQKHSPEIDRNGMVAYLTEQSNVVAAYLFGSAARRQATHLSDVDIAVLLDAEIDTESSVEQQVDLMIALEKFASHEVQVTILNRAPPLLAYQVIRDGVLLYERDETERVAFEVNVMKVYFDLKPVFEFHRQALIKRIQEEGLGRQTGHSTGTLEAAKRLRERLTGTAER